MIAQTCVLCGNQASDVAMRLIAWKQPIGRDRYTAAPRCRDLSECRTRVEALNESWDVAERAPEGARR